MDSLRLIALRVLLVLFSALVMLATPGAKAQDTCGGNGAFGTCPTQAAASAAAQSAAQARWSPLSPGWTICGPHTIETPTGNPNDEIRFFLLQPGVACSAAPSYWEITARSYPKGTESDECGPGEVSDPEHPGECLTPQKCLARNVGITGDGVRAWESKCISGCQIALQPGTGGPTTANGSTIWRGRFEYSGNVCEGGVVQNPDPDGTRTDEKTKPQECVSTGPQSRACVKPNGDTCYTTQSGRQTCWKPGETGTKTDGPVLQKRDPGHQEGAPDVQIPNGDTAIKDGSTVKTTATKPDGSTVNTSTTNYVTNSGANAGDNNQGEKDDGSGEGREGKDGEKGSASSNCTTPPACNEGDSIGCAMLRQSWLNHCDFAKPRSETMEQVVGDTSELNAIPGLSTAMRDVHGELEEAGPDTIDDGGWGGRGNCPIVLNFSAMGHSWQIDHPQLCEILDALAALILLVGAFHSTRILATGDLG